MVVCIGAKSLQLYQTLWDLMGCSPPGFSTGFFRQEYWSGLLCSLPGDLPNPGIKPMCLPFPALVGRFFTTHLVVKCTALLNSLFKSKVILTLRVYHLWVCISKKSRFPSSWSVQFNWVTHLSLTLCDPMDCSPPGLPVHHQLPELAQTHIHQVDDAIKLKVCCWTIRRRDSWPPEETNSIRGQRQGWIAQSFCVIKFY